PAPLLADSPAPALRASIFARNYLSNYSPSFLFFRGDMSTWRARVKGYGAFLPFFIPFLIAGLLMLIFSKAPERRFLLCWFLLYPIGASLTASAFPQATRSINALPCYEIIFALAAAAAADLALKKLPSRPALSVAALILAVLYFFSAGKFINHYFTEYPKYAAYEWNSGFREAFALTEKIKSNYKEIVVTRSIPYSYIYALFYTKYDPALLQETPLIPDGPYLTGKIGSYTVSDPYLQPVDMPQLYIAGVWERPDLREIPIRIPGGVPPFVKVGEYIPGNR
ncbi:MAG: hypothetical protein WCX65_09270, partial [bacterium]